MTDLPNHEKITLAEAIIWADENLAPRRERPSTLSAYVTETNAQREADKAAYAVEPVTIGDVTIVPGDVVNVSEKGRWRSKTARKLNCVYRGRAVTRGYSAPAEVLRFVAYGGSPGRAYVRGRSLPLLRAEVVGVEKVEAPDWLVNAEAKHGDLD